ncbi:MAG: tRNA preQ1(34) S-adenosylmethionine ribosyltransferase-isomerase QueA [Chloroflexi bacterium]|nr:tRNA preQ1(34) S-adenosylmethionine ribosyltransferase-isomerase QueA [Chloroflexota bacterium]
MKTADFDYTLPPDRIAQEPLEPRDQARLLVVDRGTGALAHHRFTDLPDLLAPGDLLVANDSRVIPARLYGQQDGRGGPVEVLLLRRDAEGRWEGLVRPGRRAPVGARLRFGDGDVAPVWGEVVDRTPAGTRWFRFSEEAALLRLGQVPLPPYIHQTPADPERYQTVYARVPGSAAAPTAGLHFTPHLITRLAARGIGMAFVTLHIGLDTFRPVQEHDPTQHPIHREAIVVPEETARRINETRAQGRRVVAVGTTVVRTLEQAARWSVQGPEAPLLQPAAGWADLFLLPGSTFRVVDAIITNFHLPRSTLLMLVAAFAGRDLVLRAYQEAIAQEYRFYSFGDCCLLL